MGTAQECNRLEMPSIYRQVSMFTWEEEKNGAIFRNPSGGHGPAPMFTDVPMCLPVMAERYHFACRAARFYGIAKLRGMSPYSYLLFLLFPFLHPASPLGV